MFRVCVPMLCALALCCSMREGQAQSPADGDVACAAVGDVFHLYTTSKDHGTPIKEALEVAAKAAQEIGATVQQRQQLTGLSLMTAKNVYYNPRSLLLDSGVLGSTIVQKPQLVFKPIEK